VTAGELDVRRQREVQAPFLAEISELLGAALGRPKDELRLPLQSVVLLVARYAVSTERELTVIAGRADAESSVEDHLADVALALLAQRTSRVGS
jgi:hypothetical protein